ncbi:MAG: glycosyltransferase family 4 protein [Solirubrobacterales bacterium]
MLPSASSRPTGGFKVVYEYSNRLVANRHEVSVVHPWDCQPPASPAEAVRGRIWAARASRRGGAGLAPWFELDPRVRMLAVAFPSPAAIPAADVTVATAWHTAPLVAAAVAERGGGAYYVQGYETWDGEVERVRETWRLPLRKVVISGWLEQIAAELGEAERTTRVPLGMDLERLGIDRPPAERAPRLGAIWSSAPAKGCSDVIAAMAAVRERRPEVSAFFFGTAPRPGELPEWIEYEQLPAAARLRELLNSCSVFLQASRSEGWGLPASEALLCGAALVTLDNGGSREFALDGETALVLPPERVGELGAGALALLDDEELRLRLAAAGAERLRRFTWERSLSGFEAALAVAAAAGAAL